MSRSLTPGLVLPRVVAVLALLLLFWNPVRPRALPDEAQALVLLDASLSMAGHGGPWRAAFDTARTLAHGGILWRFGVTVAAFDSSPARDGASRLGPALEAAAARGGAITIVTDGAVEDAMELPPDLRRRPRIVVLPRAGFRDAFVASVRGLRRIGAQDTVRLSVAYGTAGKGEGGRGKGTALTVNLGGRRLITRTVELPDSGTVAAELAFPASRIPPGWSALEVRVEGVGDPEPRDDVRLFAIEVSPEPAAVILAAPPDWETRFLARTLGEVARVPVRTFVETEPDRGWRDGTTLAPVATSDVQRVVDAARLVVLAGEPARPGRLRVPARAAVLAWPSPPALATEGDWYVQPPPASPLAGLLAGLPWDSLPPAAAVVDLGPDSGGTVVLTARLARRGVPQPIVWLGEHDGARRATVAAGGLWRWSFRGGAAGLAYRSLIASLADWLLGGGAGRGARFGPVTLETPNGLPLAWRWTGSGPPQDVAIGLESGAAGRVDTLRFDAGGRAELRLAPGVYRYAARDDKGGERGVIAVETWSDEWRPAAPALAAQPGLPAQRFEPAGLRDRWWLFVIAIAALAAEWAWRRRMGLP